MPDVCPGRAPRARSAVRLFPVLIVLVVACAAVVPSASGDDLRAPDLRLEALPDGTTRIIAEYVRDGQAEREVLRETRARVALEVAGGDPSGRALFATWREDGRLFEAHLRAAEGRWSAAERVSEALRLRDGLVVGDAALPAAPAAFRAGPDDPVRLVSLRTKVLPEWRAALEAAGAEVLKYVPDDAFLVRASAEVRERLAALSIVRRVEPYHPWYRLAAPVRAWIDETGAAGEMRRFRVLLFEWGAAAKHRVADRAVARGARVAALWPNGQILELWLTRAQVGAVAADPDVMWIDPWTPPETDMDLVREDAGTNYVETVAGFCGQGVRGEVLDAGIQDDHPDFDGIMLHGPTSVASHGTSTYGIVFGNGDRDGDGEAKGTGHLPCAEQGIAADYDSLGDRFAHTQELLDAPYFAHFQTNSWGDARTRSYNSTSFEMDDIIWRLDFAILQSQSNAGNQDSRPQAWAKNIISVGGIRHHDTLDTGDDNWGSGASIGPAEDGRIKPDVSYWYDSIYTTTTGSGYTAGFGGTSAATPESAGVLGLLIQMWAENVFGTDPQGATVFEKLPSFSTLKALLINTAVQYPFSGESDDLTRVHQGWGRPSARQAYDLAGRSFFVDQEFNLQVDGMASFDVQVEPGEPELKVTMVYPDPPGTTSATLHRINDLDLKVTSPSGTVYWGNNGLKANNYSQPGGGPNTVDTVENVFVQNPEDGVWKVEVIASEVNEDAVLATPELDATFSLVVTGGTGSICDAPLVDFTISPDPARVGESVQFDSTVSGGAGGPYEYAWDFDDDGVIDSTEADPVHVYRRPFDGMAVLRVRDSADCPARSEKPATITGPDLRFDAWVERTEIEGNGNGAVDPGEIHELRVVLRNDGNEDAIGVSASLVPAPSAGPIEVLSSGSSWPDIPVGATGTSLSTFRFQVGQQFPCGNDATFTLTAISTTDPANVYPDEVGAVRVLVGGAGPPQVFFSDGFESNGGWSSAGQGEWQIAAPQGLGGGGSIPGFVPNPDPDTAFEGSQVMGNDLTGLGPSDGNYESLVTSTYTSPAIDSSNASNVTMRFRRYLNVLPQDRATLEVSADGVTWTTLFDEAGGVAEDTWSLQSYDVSAWADRNPQFLVRFGLISDNAATTSGWNVDLLELEGVTSDSCEPVSRASAGAASGLTVARGAGGLELSWQPDCAGMATYGVYRGDFSIGYDSIAAEPGMCAVEGTTATVPEGSGRTEFFLVVPSDGAFEGSYGADSSGAARPAAAQACHPQDVIDACAP
ncbi:MAG: hypothetical protein Kow0062_05940 [Acidobacteriota bacterium]